MEPRIEHEKKRGKLTMQRPIEVPVNSTTRELKRLNRYYQNNEYVTAPPAQSRAFTRGEYKQLISEYHDMHPYRLVWELLYESGRRPIEVCWIELSNIDLQERVIRTKLAKTWKWVSLNGKRVRQYEVATFCISKELTQRLARYLEANKDGFRFGFLFPAPALQSKFLHINPQSLNTEMNNHRTKLGGRWLLLWKNSCNYLLGPHSFRRTWITRHLTRYRDPMFTAASVGHKDFETTYVYYQQIRLSENREFVESQVVQVKRPEVDPDQMSLFSFTEGQVQLGSV